MKIGEPQCSPIFWYFKQKWVNNFVQKAVELFTKNLLHFVRICDKINTLKKKMYNALYSV